MRTMTWSETLPAAWMTPRSGGSSCASRAARNACRAGASAMSKLASSTVAPRASIAWMAAIWDRRGCSGAKSVQVSRGGIADRPASTILRAPRSAIHCANSRPRAPSPPVTRYAASGRRATGSDVGSSTSGSRRATLRTPSRHATWSSPWSERTSSATNAGISSPQRCGSRSMMRESSDSDSWCSTRAMPHSGDCSSPASPTSPSTGWAPAVTTVSGHARSRASSACTRCRSDSGPSCIAHARSPALASHDHRCTMPRSGPSPATASTRRSMSPRSAGRTP